MMWNAIWGCTSSILAGLVIWAIKEIHEDRKKLSEKHDRAAKQQQEEIEALKLGMQAMLRNSLRKEYAEAQVKGYVTFADIDNFENMYKQYEKLGPNGPMSQIHDEYISMEKRPDDVVEVKLA